MNFIDFVIVLILIAVVGIVIYFSFIKDRGNPCKGCVYYKKCKKQDCDHNK